MYQNPDKEPGCYHCSHRTDVDLLSKDRSSASDFGRFKSKSDYKLIRSCNKPINRYTYGYNKFRALCDPKDSHTSSRQLFNEIVLVNITDQHTTTAADAAAACTDYLGESKTIKKFSKSAKKRGKGSLNGSTSGKTSIRAKHNVKGNNTYNVAKEIYAYKNLEVAKVRDDEIITNAYAKYAHKNFEVAKVRDGVIVTNVNEKYAHKNPEVAKVRNSVMVTNVNEKYSEKNLEGAKVTRVNKKFANKNLQIAKVGDSVMVTNVNEKYSDKNFEGAKVRDGAMITKVNKKFANKNLEAAKVRENVMVTNVNEKYSDKNLGSAKGRDGAMITKVNKKFANKNLAKVEAAKVRDSVTVTNVNEVHAHKNPEVAKVREMVTNVNEKFAHKNPEVAKVRDGVMVTNINEKYDDRSLEGAKVRERVMVTKGNKKFAKKNLEVAKVREMGTNVNEKHAQQNHKVAKVRDGAMVTNVNEIYAYKHIEDVIKDANVIETCCPAHITKQIKTNIANIRAKSKKRVSKIKDEIKEEEICCLRKEILEYKLKSEECLPECEFSCNKHTQCQSNSKLCQKDSLTCELTSNKFTQCQSNSKLCKKVPLTCEFSCNTHTQWHCDSKLNKFPLTCEFTCGKHCHCQCDSKLNKIPLPCEMTCGKPQWHCDSKLNKVPLPCEMTCGKPPQLQCDSKLNKVSLPCEMTCGKPTQWQCDSKLDKIPLACEMIYDKHSQSLCDSKMNKVPLTCEMTDGKPTQWRCDSKLKKVPLTCEMTYDKHTQSLCDSKLNKVPLTCEMTYGKHTQSYCDSKLNKVSLTCEMTDGKSTQWHCDSKLDKIPLACEMIYDKHTKSLCGSKLNKVPLTCEMTDGKPTQWQCDSKLNKVSLTCDFTCGKHCHCQCDSKLKKVPFTYEHLTCGQHLDQCHYNYNCNVTDYTKIAEKPLAVTEKVDSKGDNKKTTHATLMPTSTESTDFEEFSGNTIDADELDPITMDEEDKSHSSQNNWPPTSCGAHSNTPSNVESSVRNSQQGNEAFLNESFLRDQIAGMKKIDKLVEEAEQSISKVVKGFDKYFKEPVKDTYSRTDSIISDAKHKSIGFDIDDTCDCPEIMLCDCEINDELDEKHSFLAEPISDPYSDIPTTDSDHLNTISERTEANVVSTPESLIEVKSVISDTVVRTDVPLTVKNIKKNAKISIDTRNIVHIPPLDMPTHVAPMLQEMATETDTVPRTHVNVLEVQNIPGVEIRSSLVVQKIYNIHIKPSSNLSNQNNLSNSQNTYYIELKHDDPISLQMIAPESCSEIKGCSNKSSFTTPEIQVLKAPNLKVSIKDSRSKNCRRCKHSRGTEMSNKDDQTIDQLMNTINDFQIPASTISSARDNFDDNNTTSSSASEYVIVTDNETQVSIKSSRGKQNKEPCNNQTCTNITKSSVGNNTSSKTFPTNVRPPIPNEPIAAYLPLPYDAEEVDEILILTNPLDSSNTTPFNLSNTNDSRIVQIPNVSEVPSRFNDEKELQRGVPQQGSCDFTLESCSTTTMDRALKCPKLDPEDMECLKNAYDFSAAINESEYNINTSCVRKLEERYGPDVMACVNTKSNANKPNADFGSEPEAEEPTVNPNAKPVTFATRNEERSISDLDYSMPIIDSSERTPLEIEGVEIMDPMSPLQNLYQTPQGLHNINATTMSAMVQYDQPNVTETLAQNLLLSQLLENLSQPQPQPQSDIAYHKRPGACCDTTSSDSSTRSSGDYPEVNKYLMQAKRKNFAQRGIITDDPEGILATKSIREQQLSDGEMSQYSSSTGEVMPIGPNLLKNRKFMRRRPDRVFQMELVQRDMHIKRQYNYFNNWVSYYVEENQHPRS